MGLWLVRVFFIAVSIVSFFELRSVFPTMLEFFASPR